MIRILHISDFHLENEKPSLRKQNIIKSLIEDLRNYVNDDTIFVLTGDLVDRGGHGFEGRYINSPFAKVNEILFNPLVRTFPELKNRIFIVPGNHDTFRDRVDSISEKGLLELSTSREAINDFITKKIKENDFKHLERIEEYKNFERTFYDTYFEKLITNFHSTFKVSLAGNRVGISCLNSAWLSKDNDDRGKLIVGQSQIEHSLNFIDDCNIKIALIHHPLEFLSMEDFEDCKKLLQLHYHILLNGHTHSLESGLNQTMYGNLFLSVSNSTIADDPKERKYINGYQVIDFVPKKGFTVHYRKYVESATKFFSHNDVGEESGIKEYSLPSSVELEKYLNTSSIIDSLKRTYCEKLDEHLIIYNSGAKAPCTIDAVFVEPEITNYPENSAFEEKEIIKYSVNDIISDSGNFLVYGQKEFGKTILIDKMFLEYLKRFDQVNAIPVMIRFSDIKNYDIEKVIKDFIQQSSEDTRDLLSKCNFVLLVDDLNFEEKSSKQIQRLADFVVRYPHVRIIATTEQLSEAVLPVEYLEYNGIFKFTPGYMQALGSKQIKQLIRNWFIGQDVDFHESIEKLVKNFKSLSLPRTPLAVTLFLWIIERQERRPINNANLVQLFVENLLQKANFENVYTDTFDFGNKQRLLSHLAKHMLDVGNPDDSYALDDLEALRFVKEYLKGKFTANAQVILSDFVKRGILSSGDQTSIRFKSAFFFHYFLAVYMSNNDEFLSYVLTEEHFLDFADEINYYTGLKRDSIRVLQFTQQKLNEAFNDLNEIMADRSDEIDDFFDNRDHLSARLSLDNAKNKPSEKKLEESYDAELSQIPVQAKVIKKGAARSSLRDIDAVLKLAAIVLKNSEEIDDFDARVKAYNNIAFSSISFLVLYKESLVDYYKEFQKKPDGFPKNIKFGMFIRLLPLIHQVVFFEWLGTPKLKEVISSKINEDKNTLNTSELEKFISVFTYSDSRASKYTEIIKDFLKRAKRGYILDAIFFKILSYYFLRSKDKETDLFYLNLLADIKEKLGQITKKTKSEFILKLTKEKQLKLFNKSDD